jgi:hypothetical protein
MFGKGECNLKYDCFPHILMANSYNHRRYTVNWICLTELRFEKVKKIPVSQRSPGYRAIGCYDGTEISAQSGYKVLRAFSAEEEE